MFPVAILTPEPSCVMVVSALVPDTGLLFHPFNVPVSKSVLEITSADATNGALLNKANIPVAAQTATIKDFLNAGLIFN
jgi:hypothetical protein